MTGCFVNCATAPKPLFSLSLSGLTEAVSNKVFKDGSQVLPEKQASKVGVEKTRQKGSSQSYNYLNTYSQRKVLLAHSERNYYYQIVLLAETPSEMYYWVQCDMCFRWGHSIVTLPRTYWHRIGKKSLLLTNSATLILGRTRWWTS